MRPYDRIAGLQALVETARRGSFVAAAHALEVDVSVVSRRVSGLERRLGVRLIQRSTRRLHLTDAGRAYVERGAALLDELAALDDAVADGQGTARGLLRIAVPNAFGRCVVLPALTPFMHAHPMIDVDLHFSDAYVDLVGQGFDLALRIGTLPSSGLVARKLGAYRRFLAASPAYLDAAGVPAHPADLAQHRCLQFAPLAGGAVWALERLAERCTVDVGWRLRSSDVFASHHAAVAGLGIAATADFVAAQALRSGQLVPVLADWRFADAAVHAVHAAGSYVPLRARAFIDHMAQALDAYR